MNIMHGYSWFLSLLERYNVQFMWLFKSEDTIPKNMCQSFMKTVIHLYYNSPH